MRSDMQKVVVESGRRGGQGHSRDHTKPRRVGEDFEGYLKHAGMKRPYGYDTKSQTDLLGPLFRYLDKHVGKRWDDVYSDICKNLDFRSVLGFHILSHLKDYVTLHAVIFDRVAYRVAYKYGRHERGAYDRVRDLYVHPTTGILCRQKEESRTKWKPRVNPNVRVLDATRKLWFIHGAWFIVTYAPSPKYGPVPDIGVPFEGEERRLWRIGHKLHVYGAMYAVSKRQLSKKEKKKYGVK